MYQMQTVRKMVIGPGNVQKTSKTRKQTEARKTEQEGAVNSYSAGK